MPLSCAVLSCCAVCCAFPCRRRRLCLIADRDRRKSERVSVYSLGVAETSMSGEERIDVRSGLRWEGHDDGTRRGRMDVLMRKEGVSVACLVRMAGTHTYIIPVCPWDFPFHSPRTQCTEHAYEPFPRHISYLTADLPRVSRPGRGSSPFSS